MELTTGTPGGAISAYRYLAVYVVLLVLTGSNIGLAFVDLGRFNVIVAVVIAVCQATLAALYFMDLRDSSRLTWLVASVAVAWLIILITATIADVLMRGGLGIAGS